MACKICGGTHKKICNTCKGFGHKMNGPIYKIRDNYRKGEETCSCCEGEGKVDCICIGRKFGPKKS